MNILVLITLNFGYLSNISDTKVTRYIGLRRRPSIPVKERTLVRLVLFFCVIVLIARHAETLTGEFDGQKNGHDTVIVIGRPHT